jgi:hypothetical protein
MIKLSKKQLKQEAEYNEAYYFTGNLYSYENIVACINSLCYFKNRAEKYNEERLEDLETSIYKNCNKNYLLSAEDLVNNIKNIDYEDYKMEKIAYSAGVYGNSGQLHTLKLYKNNDIVAMYYMYY